MNNSSRAFPVNVSIAPPHPAAFERVTEFERSRSYRLTCIGLLVWWIASLYPLMAPHSPEEQLNQEAATTAQETTQGSLINQSLVLSFALLGAIYLPRAIRGLRARQQTRQMVYLLGAYLLWSGATIVWSDDIGLTIRRLGTLVLLLIGAIGLGAGFYSQTRKQTLTIARHVLYAAWIAIAVLTVFRIANRNFSELLSPEFTLKGG